MFSGKFKNILQDERFIAKYCTKMQLFIKNKYKIEEHTLFNPENMYYCKKLNIK